MTTLNLFSPVYASARPEQSSSDVGASAGRERFAALLPFGWPLALLPFGHLALSALVSSELLLSMDALMLAFVVLALALHRGGPTLLLLAALNAGAAIVLSTPAGLVAPLLALSSSVLLLIVALLAPLLDRQLDQLRLRAADLSFLRDLV